MRQVAFFFFLSFFFLSLSRNVLAAQPPEPHPAEIRFLFTYTVDSLTRYFEKRKIPKKLVRPRYDVDMYEVTYEGLWLDSQLIKAKGVWFVPKNKAPMPELLYGHGTRISEEQTYGIKDQEQFIALIMAGEGYISYFPFYYGLGGGDQEHIYQHSWTEAAAMIYMLKACRKRMPELGIQTTDQLFVTGYSQGGHAALATQFHAEAGTFGELKITASAPMSGAYDMSNTQAVTMFQHFSRPHYLPYLLISYQYAYNLLPGDAYSAFKAPFDESLRDMFSRPRKIDYQQMDAILPKIPALMVKDSLVELFRTDPDFPFRVRLRENDLYDWKPKSPVLLCACKGDGVVLPENTRLAYTSMRAHGAPVHRRVFGKKLGHNPCAPFAVMYMKMYFDSIRDGKSARRRVKFPQGTMIKLGIWMEQRKISKRG